ncbi:MAG: helix-turn-helix domain-containing protein [Parvularculaceae bacterium]
MISSSASVFAPGQSGPAGRAALGASPATIVRKLKAGETLFVEGEPARYCYEVVSGVMKEYCTLEDGQREISDFYSAGDFVGVCGHDEQTQTAEAVTHCLLRCIPLDALLGRPGFELDGPPKLVDVLVSRLDRSRERSTLISRRNAEQRVAGFLRFLSRRSADAQTISIPMSRQDIGDYLGLTIETVCRTLTEFKRSGVIVMPTARSFVIQDEAALDAAEGAL